MNEKWDEIQGKLDLVRVSREFGISEFEISGFYLFYFIYFICHTINKSAFFLEGYTTNGERSGLRNTWDERKNLRTRPFVLERKLNNFFDGSHL